MFRKWIRNVIPLISLLLYLKSARNIELDTNVSVPNELENAKMFTTEPKNSDNRSIHRLLNGDEQQEDNFENLTNGIFWSDYAEDLVPKGSTFNQSMKLIQNFRVQRAISIYRANQSVCGSGHNGIIQLTDETRICARNEKYKLSVYAESLAFHLSRLLRMDNIPEVILVSANISSERWNGLNMSALNWKDNQTVALIKWLPNANSKTYMPQLIKQAFLTGEPVTVKILQRTEHNRSTPGATSELIQWGTIIIFDNLIGHYDRLMKYQQVNHNGATEEILDRDLYNSIKSPNSKIWLIDNESAFFYQAKFENPIYRYSQLVKFTDRLLKTMCIFQSSFVDELRHLSRQKSPFQFLFDYVRSFEPFLDNVRRNSRFDLYGRFFNSRLGQILEWIEYCKHLVNAK